MIKLDIPGYGDFAIQHLVLDYHGTLALDGSILLGVARALDTLAKYLQIHVLTDDSSDLTTSDLTKLPVTLKILAQENQTQAKQEYITTLDATTVIAIGNGRNDRLMLKQAAVGIFLAQKEGGAVDALSHADVIAVNLLEAFDLILHPLRLAATLRS